MTFSSKTFVSALLVLVFACAPVKNQNSITRSLDNLAATPEKGYTTNDCGSKYLSIDSVPQRTKKYEDKIKSHDDILKLAALNALHHVPAAFSAPFFKQGGTIELSPNSVETCKSSPLTAKEKRYIKESNAEVDSCWLQPDPKKAPIVVLPSDEGKIRHNLLRVMVYFYNEYLVTRLDKATAKKKKYEAVRTAIAGFNAEKKKIMETFLEDAAVYNLNASKKLWDLRSESESKFANIVLAEAVDSYYCSKETLTKFRSQFNQTYKLFSNQQNPNSFAQLLGKPLFQK